MFKGELIVLQIVPVASQKGVQGTSRNRHQILLHVRRPTRRGRPDEGKVLAFLCARN